MDIFLIEKANIIDLIIATDYQFKNSHSELTEEAHIGERESRKKNEEEKKKL